MLRVVLDTSVVATAFRSNKGASFALLQAVASNQIRLIATPPLFLEYEDVLKRPEQRVVTRLSLADVDQVLDALAAWIEPVEVHLHWRPQLRDPGDELVLEAAVNGRADALVTFNIRDFVAAAPRFGIRLAKPVEILREIRDE